MDFQFLAQQVQNALAGAGAAQAGADPRKLAPPPPGLGNNVEPKAGAPEGAFSEMFAGYASDAALAGPSAVPKDGQAPQKTQATKEQLEKADADRKQLKEQLEKNCRGLSEEERERILARTNGLSGDALVTEMAAIENAMVDKDGVPRANADRALGAYADVAKLAAEADAKGEHGAHITPEIMSELVNGVAEERAKGEDERGILGRRNAREAAKGLIAMTPENFAKTEKLLEDAKTDADGKELPEADAAAQQALILKAVGARRDLLSWPGVPGEEGPDTLAFADLQDFAGKIRGKSQKELIESTSVQALKNTHDGASAQEEGTSLQQQFQNTCAQTTGQLVAAEADPIYAMRLKEEGFAAQEQKYLHEESTEGAAVRTREEDAAEKTVQDIRRRINGAVGAKEDPVDPEDAAALNKLLAGKLIEPVYSEWYDEINPFASDEAQEMVKNWRDAQDALEAVREKNNGHPTDDEIKTCQSLNNEDLDKAKHVQTRVDESLQMQANGRTHLSYKEGGEDTANVSDQKLDSALKDGQTVPIRVADSAGNGHSMSISDVRPDKDGNPQYFVHDPMTGKSVWVPKFKLDSGQFTVEFGISNSEYCKIEGMYIGEDQVAPSRR